MYLSETAKKLGDAGYRVDIYTVAALNQPSSIQILDTNVRLIYLAVDSREPVTKENLIHYIPQIFQQFNKTVAREGKSYSAVHSHYWLSGLLGELVCRKYNLLHLITFHTLGAVKNRACGDENEPALRIHHENHLVKNCDRIVAFTKEEKEDLRSLYRADTAKIDCIPCGVNQRVFYPLDRDECRNKLKIPEKTKVILFVGRFVSIKGIEPLLQAFSLLQKYPLQLQLVGGEESEAAAVKKKYFQAYSLRESEEIFFPGTVDQQKLRLYYSAADALVIPSYHESFCLVALEALSCGIPIIASAVGGIPEIVTPGTGVIVKPADAGELAEAISAMLFSKDIQILSRNDLRHSVSAYSWDRTAMQLMHIFEEYKKYSREM